MADELEALRARVAESLPSDFGETTGDPDFDAVARIAMEAQTIAKTALDERDAAQAEVAGMREALRTVIVWVKNFRNAPSEDDEDESLARLDEALMTADAALSGTAGKPLLDRIADLESRLAAAVGALRPIISRATEYISIQLRSSAAPELEGTWYTLTDHEVENLRRAAAALRGQARG